MIHKGNLGDLAANDESYVLKSFWISRQIPGALVKLGRIGIGVQIARDFVIYAKNVLDVAVSGEIGSQSIQFAIELAIGNIVT